MANIISIHPTHPQPRLLQRVVAALAKGGVIVYPTDSGYALGCQIGEKDAVEKIRRLRQLGKHHHFTLVCHNLSQLSEYAQVNNPTFRLLKAYTPGAYTFILTASKEVPRRLSHPKRKTIGLRVPDHKVPLAILEALGQPLMSVTLILEGSELPLGDMEEIEARIGQQVALIVDSGYCGVEPTSIVDLTGGVPEVIRAGKGDISVFE